uniref:RNA-directed DNA polymerase, eukaryota, nucleotide-binding alpha-beta plait domain protein n=1 Tax=Tanacetum cinerariifolium TaxID=118510 RepID=A0A6L2KXT8_TANCI|nr:RNA-directed DNA polymerase, eukaryota, nucleotide-binding alpha-beta plait domain protein [Tanacetum cinerariifolium]
MVKPKNITDSSGWTWIFRNNKKTVEKQIDYPFHKEVKKLATSFYVSNIPNSVDANGLWKICTSHGRLVDTFIANKLSKGGKRFGFIRFLGIKDETEFVKSLSNILIRSYHLYISVARSQRISANRSQFNHNITTKDKNPKPNPSRYPNNIPLKSKDKFPDLPSFVYVTNGIAKPIVDTSSTNANIRALVLDDQDLINVEDPSMVLLVKLKDVNSMSNMFVICRNEDVNGIKKAEDYVDKNSLEDLNDFNDLKETINELASNEIEHPISKGNTDQEDDIDKVSLEIAVSSNLSQRWWKSSVASRNFGICLRENVYGSSSEKVEGHGDWNAPEYTDTTGTYDGEINLAFDENFISKEYAVKLCLDYKVKKRNKVVKKELIVALKGELYFIINPKEDDVEPGVIFERSLMRLVNGIIDFGSGVITVYPEEDLFKDDSEKTKKSMDDWDQLLDFNFDDIPRLDGEELSPFDKVELDGMIMKEQEEAIKKVKGEALKEKDDPRAFIFPIRLGGKVNENALADTGSDINTMTYRIYEQLGRKEIKKTMGGNDDEVRPSRSKRSRQYKTIEEVLLPQVHHEFLLREGCNRDAKSRYNTKLANLLPRHVYSPCVINWDILNRMGCDGEIDDMLRIKLLRLNLMKKYSLMWRELELLTSKNQFIQSFATNFIQPMNLMKLGLYHAVELQDDGFDVHQNGYANVAWLIARWIKRKGAGTQKESQICCGQFITKLARKSRVLSDEVLRSLSTPTHYRDLDTTTLRELIDYEGRLTPEDPQPGVPRIGISRLLRASMQDLYERMGNIKIRQGASERMSYRQSYHWDIIISVISSTHLSHRSINSSSMMMMSSVEMTQEKKKKEKGARRNDVKQRFK